MLGRIHLTAQLFQVIETVSLQSAGQAADHFVPLVPRRITFVAGAGVDEEQCADALGIFHVERQRHVTAQRMSSDDGVFVVQRVQQGLDVVHRFFDAVARLLGGAARPAMASHIPGDQLVAEIESLGLAAPHARCRREAMGQQDRRTRSIRFVVERAAGPFDLAQLLLPSRFENGTHPRTAGALVSTLHDDRSRSRGERLRRGVHGASSPAVGW